MNTIMVSLNEVGRAKALMEVAFDLAARQNAHLVGLYVIPAIQVFPSIGMELAPQVFEGYRDFFKAHARSIRDSFEETAKRHGIAAEWRLVESNSPVIADATIEHGMVCDLLIASQVDPRSQTGVELDFPHRVVMGLGRPVLLIPFGHEVRSVGTTALVAWNGTREAARAAFDALPLLAKAQAVTITWVDPQKTLEAPGSIPGAELATVLARHGIKVTAEGYPTAGLTVGEALRLKALDLGADLVVMGAYGHSRMREYVFGGATRFMLENMTVPVLLSH